MAINIGIDKYVRWPFKYKALLWLGFALVVCVAYYFALFAPKRAEIQALKQESSKLAGQIVEKKAIADNLQSVKDAVTQMDKLLSQALEKLPSAEEIPKLLKTISDLGKETGLEPLLFRPGATTPVGPEYFYASIPLDMEQNGNFYSLARFFDKVGRLPRIVTVENITVTTVDNAKAFGPLLKASFKAVTFKYLKPEERPKKEAAPKGKGAKG